MTMIASPNAEWLGRLPTSWSVSTVRKLVEDINIRNYGSENENYLSLMANVGVILYADKGDIGNKKPEDLSKCKIVKIGDLVINSMNYGIGSYGISRYEGICSPVYLVLRTKPIIGDRSYVKRIFEIPQFQRLAQSFGNGILEHRRAIGWDTIKNLPVPIPPLATQRTIAAFLDRETAQIDDLIGKQERLIELLAEKRQAIVTNALTKGLDPNAPTKPSGIPWLGDVPAHWSVRKFSQVTSVNGGQVDPRQEPWANMLLIAPNHVESGTGRITYRETSAEQGADSGKYLVKAGEVIYSKIRPYLRKVVIAPEDCLCSADMYGISALPSAMSNRFLQELMLSQPFTDFTADSSARVAMPKINREALAQGFLWYPPLSEQEAILGYIDCECALMDQLEKRSRKFIALLRERRSALIAAAVTGKIDVTNEGVAA